MKFNDAMIGAVLLVLVGGASLVTSRLSRRCRARTFGPALFPGMLAVRPRRLRRSLLVARGLRRARQRPGSRSSRGRARRAHARAACWSSRRAACSTSSRADRAGLHPDAIAHPARAVPRCCACRCAGVCRSRWSCHCWSSTSFSTSCSGCRCPGAAGASCLVRRRPEHGSASARPSALVFDPYILLVMLRVGAVRPVRRRDSRADRDHGDGAAGAGHLLHAAGAGDRRHRHGDRDGDLRRRHSRLPAAHSRHARLGRLHRRSLRDDAEGPGRTGARRRSGVLGRSAACSAPRC